MFRTAGIAAGITAAVIGLLGSALHIWFNNRKLGMTTGLERDKQIDARTVRLFDQMEEHYKELLTDKNNTIKTYRDIVKQKDSLLEGHRQLNAAQIVANNMPPVTPVAEPAPTV